MVYITYKLGYACSKDIKTIHVCSKRFQCPGSEFSRKVKPTDWVGHIVGSYKKKIFSQKRQMLAYKPKQKKKCVVSEPLFAHLILIMYK